MTEIEIYGTDKRVSIPSSWDEMLPKQIRHVFRLYDRCVTKRISPLEFNIRTLYYFLGLKRKGRELVREKAFPARLQRKAENVYMLCESCLGFMFSSEEGKPLSLTFDSLKNPLPSVRPRFCRRLHGPDDMLYDITFGEFRHASVCLNEFFKTKDMAQMDECIAHLYKPKARKFNLAGRRAKALNNSNIETAIRRASRLDSWQKNLIMMWLSACLNYLQTGKVVIDGEEVDMSLLFSKSDDDQYRRSDHGYSWNDLLIEIAKEQSIGNMERVDEEPLFSIFSIMWHNYKERKRYEKAAKVK